MRGVLRAQRSSVMPGPRTRSLGVPGILPAALAVTEPTGRWTGTGPAERAGLARETHSPCRGPRATASAQLCGLKG